MIRQSPLCLVAAREADHSIVRVRVLNAIDQVMRVLPLEALIEGLQASEVHQIGVFHYLDGDSRAPKELFENDGRMRDVPFPGQRFNPATSNLRCIGEHLDHHQRAAFSARLPPP